jgi:hypothetical protein
MVKEPLELEASVKSRIGNAVARERRDPDEI